MKFKKIETPIPGLLIIEPRVLGDNRGFFMESYTKRDFAELGISDEFVQDNHSKSRRGVLRGLHFQIRRGQGKLIRVIAGRVLDVEVDLRSGSPTFGRWFKALLSAENKRMMFVPGGFAHGFLALADDTEFLYKCTDYYYPEDESGILWNDPDVGIAWEFGQYGLQESDLTLSEKDRKQQSFREFLTSGVKL
jgi:dTDP-4-dehydrorhamnose 3,5-epimerase